jgi:lysozyme family protein
MELTNSLKDEYLTLWSTCVANPRFKSEIDQNTKLIKRNRDRYESVSDKTGVPWYVIAVIHQMESDFDFNTHLHNGDPLKGRTTQVPAGRPVGGSPPFDWEYSAIDALEYDRATGVKSWDLPTLFWFLEGFNGWGYRVGQGRDTTPKNRSQYIYSASNHYVKGRYTSDTVFDKDSVSEQVGCMIQLREMENQGVIQISPTEVLNRNSIGTVAAWQHVLNGCGYFPTLLITGNMDTSTINTTKQFQEDVGQSVTGTVSLLTWQAGIDHRKLKSWTDVIPPVIKNQPPPKTVPPVPPVGTLPAGKITKELINFYSKASNYDKVYNNVMGWFGTTSNACVAFVSTALRLTGYSVPFESNSEGGISVWTSALSKYLEGRGWTRHTNADLLEPGDIVFTDDAPFTDKIPMHTYVFVKWSDKANRVAFVIDNQDFTHLRNINKAGGGFNFTPFEYFLRG